MEFLSWNLARNIQVNEPLMYEDMRTTHQQSIRKIVQSLNFVRSKGCKVRFHGHTKNESAHYCGICEEEVFDVLLIRDCEKRHVVHCLRCVKSPNLAGKDLNGVIALVQYPLKDLLEVYDNFVLVKIRPASNEP
jgi:histone demethylase